MAQNTSDSAEMYRSSSLGASLIDALDNMVHEGRLEPQLATKVVSTFDKVLPDVLAERVKARLNFKGHLHTYRFCDDVWTFVVKGVNLKLDNQSTMQSDRIKIVSVNSKRPEA